jgi:preprotein translocase subunit SecG
MFIFVSIIYILVCAFLISVVLLQQGKGGGMGSAFGGGGSNTVFGGAGAGNVLTRATAVAATLFMVLSALLSYMSSSSDAVLERIGAEQEAANTATISEEDEEDDAEDAPVEAEEVAPLSISPEEVEVLLEEEDGALDEGVTGDDEGADESPAGETDGEK